MQKPFRIERFLPDDEANAITARSAARSPAPLAALSNGDAAPAHSAAAAAPVLAAIEEVKALIEQRLPEGGIKAAPAMPFSDPDELKAAMALRHELDLMRAAIERTKMELCSLHQNLDEKARMQRVASELDAIVSGTEGATERILAAAEKIDECAAHLQSSATSDQDRASASEIQDAVVEVFEACNFQDLTGQRITKVVNTFKFVEERITKMVDIWGGIGSFQGLPQEQAKPAPEFTLEGPALESDDDRISQDDIDALFP